MQEKNEIFSIFTTFSRSPYSKASAFGIYSAIEIDRRRCPTMYHRPAPYTGRRTAPPRRSVPPRKAPPRTAAHTAQEKPAARRRLAQMAISAALLVAVVSMKLLFPAALERCRATLLELIGADTDFVEVFAAAGRAFSDGSTVSDALNDAYTAVFGASEVSDEPAVQRTAATPENADMLQRVLNFDYTDPISAGQITSLFGLRSDPLDTDARFHYGLDIAGDEDAVISAFADGTVTAIGNSSDLGKYVTVTHADGYSTLYAHCAKITASDGQQVKIGDPIAEMGDTGRATGVHLHFELHQDNTYLNPIYYVTFA